VYGPTIFMERVMPSGFAAKTFSFGVIGESAAGAEITIPVQTRATK